MTRWYIFGEPVSDLSSGSLAFAFHALAPIRFSTFPFKIPMAPSLTMVVFGIGAANCDRFGLSKTMTNMCHTSHCGNNHCRCKWPGASHFSYQSKPVPCDCTKMRMLLVHYVLASLPVKRVYCQTVI